MLPYRDVFDNHSPLFQALYAPLFQLLGERADILFPMRLAMIPLFVVCLGLVWKIGTWVFWQRAGLWAAAFTACYRPFFLTSTEFRPDDLWTSLSTRHGFSDACWVNPCIGQTCSILILAASVFHWSGHQGVAAFEDAYKLLSPLLGVGAASVLFAVALLASGQNSTLTGTLAGQIVMEGFLKLPYHSLATAADYPRDRHRSSRVHHRPLRGR